MREQGDLQKLHLLSLVTKCLLTIHQKESEGKEIGRKLFAFRGFQRVQMFFHFLFNLFHSFLVLPTYSVKARILSIFNIESRI